MAETTREPAFAARILAQGDLVTETSLTPRRCDQDDLEEARSLLVEVYAEV